MNPYASYLAGQDAVEVISKTPEELRTLIEQIGSRVDEPIAPGKWSPRQIICHLADTNMVFSYRMRQCLAEEHHTVQPFEQDDWVKQYANYDADSALALLASLRSWNVAFLKSVSKEQYSKIATHPVLGDLTFRDLVEFIAGHEINHLQQLRAVAQRSSRESASA